MSPLTAIVIDLDDDRTLMTFVFFGMYQKIHVRPGDQCSACFGQLLTHLGTVWEDSETLRSSDLEKMFDAEWAKAYVQRILFESLTIL